MAEGEAATCIEHDATPPVTSTRPLLGQVTVAEDFSIRYYGPYKIVQNELKNETYVLYQCGTPNPADLPPDTIPGAPPPRLSGGDLSHACTVPRRPEDHTRSSIAPPTNRIPAAVKPQSGERQPGFVSAHVKAELKDNQAVGLAAAAVAAAARNSPLAPLPAHRT